MSCWIGRNSDPQGDILSKTSQMRYIRGTAVFFVKSLQQSSYVMAQFNNADVKHGGAILITDYWKMRAWIWMKFCVSTGVGTWTKWSTLEPDPDHSPDAGTGKSESRRSVEVRQTGTSLRASYRSRDALQRDTVYSTLWSSGQGVSWSGRLFCTTTTYGCGATGRQTCPIFGFWPL